MALQPNLKDFDHSRARRFVTARTLRLMTALPAAPAPKRGNDWLEGPTKEAKIKNLVAAIERKDISQHDIRHVRIDGSHADLRGINLRVLGGRVLSQGQWQGANLSGQNLSNLNLTSFFMPYAIAHGIRFDNSTISYASMDGAHMDRANFYNATGFAVSMNRTVSRGTNFEGVLRGAKAFNADLRDSFFSGKSDFSHSRMGGVNLSGARTVGGSPSFYRVEAEGAALLGNYAGWNFGGADLRNVNGEGSVFTRSKFAGAEITGMRLKGAVLKDNDIAEARDFDRVFTIAIPTPSFGWARRRRPPMSYRALQAALMEREAPQPDFTADNDGEPELSRPAYRRMVQQAFALNAA